MQVKPIYALLLSGALDHVSGEPGFYERYIAPHEERYEWVNGKLQRVQPPRLNDFRRGIADDISPA